MSLTALLWIHLAWECCGRHVPALTQPGHSFLHKDSWQLSIAQTSSSISSLGALAKFFLIFHPSAAFHFSGPGAYSHARRSARRSGLIVSKRKNEPENFADPKYWNKKYTEDSEPVDWIAEYWQIRELLEEVTGGSRHKQILHVGCGNSLLSEEMFDDGYHSVVNTDVSSIVIEQMRKRNQKKRPDMVWQVQDCTEMDFEDGRFDVILDKGVLDAVDCDSGMSLVKPYLEEVQRVLRPDGVFLCVSLARPKGMLNKLIRSRAHLAIDTSLSEEIDDESRDWAYVCRKRQIRERAASPSPP